MKNETPLNPKQVRVKETIGFTLNDVTVFTHIDYNTRQISLVEKDGSDKKWLFAKRTPEYFNGWKGVFAAMTYAVEQAEKRLSEQPSLMEQVLIAEALKK